MDVIRISQNEKKYDAIANILNALYNFSDKVFEYQNGKKVLAENFAKTIDKLTLLAKRQEQYKLNKHQYTKEEQKKIDDEMKTIIQEESGLIDTLTIVQGIASSPAGNDEEFLLSSSIYLRQKNNEKVKELTTYYIQDVRDSFLIRNAIDVKIWDLELRKVMQSIIALSSNISASIRKDNVSGGQDQPENQDLKKQREQNQSEKYGIF